MEGERHLPEIHDFGTLTCDPVKQALLLPSSGRLRGSRGSRHVLAKSSRERSAVWSCRSSSNLQEIVPPWTASLDNPCPGSPDRERLRCGTPHSIAVRGRFQTHSPSE